MAPNVSFIILCLCLSGHISKLNVFYWCLIVFCSRYDASLCLQDDHDEFKTVINDTLERHNFYREKHNVPALRIDSKVRVQLNGIVLEL